MAIYVVSDIHGYYDPFMNGLSQISFSDGDFLWLIGAVIDRGPDGIRILQHVMNHQNMDLVIGNHELMMLNSVSPQGDILCDGRDASIWLGANGGWPTLEGYKSLTIEEKVNLLYWLKSRYIIKTLEVNKLKFCLTHSYYNPECENKRYNDLKYYDVWNVTWSSIWRDDYYSHALDIYGKYDCTFISGHVPVQDIKNNPNKHGQLGAYYHGNLIDIDGGCSLGIDYERENGIVFLRLDDMKEYYMLLE